MTILIYDSSFCGFLSTIFHSYEMKLKSVDIQKNVKSNFNFFDPIETVASNENNAKRIWKGLKKVGGSETCRQVYTAYLSEIPEIENTLLYYIRKTFTHQRNISHDYSDPKLLHISKVCKMVGREKHRMDAFVRFKLTKDGFYFATIEPDFNVLPLNATHFKNRYADQKWIIYDLKRKYGLFYDLNTVETIEMTLTPDMYNKTADSVFFTSEECCFQELWKNYFTSTNITSRKNMKLHLQHVPKRYWKYLSEKTPNVSYR